MRQKNDPVDWARAKRAMRRYIVDPPSNGNQIFEIQVALDGGATERIFQEFLSEPSAPDLLLEQSNLHQALVAHATLTPQPVNTLGTSYARLMDIAGLPADGVAAIAAGVTEFAELSPGKARAWFADRQASVHDLLHTITGYGQDLAGEAAVNAFTYGLYGRRLRVLALRVGLVAWAISAPRGSILRTLRYLFQAYRRGRNARIPFSFRWEDMLGLPLDDVRDTLNIAAPLVAHPQGILTGAKGEPWVHDHRRAFETFSF